MATVEELRLQIKADVADAVAKLKQYQRSTKETQESNTTLAVTFARMRDVMQGPIAAGQMVISAFRKIKAVTDQMETAWNTQEQAVSNVNAVLFATGNAVGKTSKQIQDAASDLQQATLYGDEAILNMNAVLLGFRSIKGDQFDRVTESVLDMSTIMGTDLVSSANMLGKAMDAPTKGMTALSRVGFVFSEQDKELVKQLEDSGDMLGAQELILKEVEKAFGGAAKAAGETGSAIKIRLGNAIGDLNEQLGRSISNNMKPWRLAWLGMAEAIGASIKAQNDFTDAMNKVKGGTATTEDRLLVEQNYLKVLQDQLKAAKDGGGAVSEMYGDTSQVEAQISMQQNLVRGLEMQKKYAGDLAQAEAKGQDAAVKILEEKKAAEEWQILITEKRIDIESDYQAKLREIARQEKTGMIDSKEAESQKQSALEGKIDSLATLIETEKLGVGATTAELDKQTAAWVANREAIDAAARAMATVTAYAAKMDEEAMLAANARGDAIVAAAVEQQQALDAIIEREQRLSDATESAYAAMGKTMADSLLEGESLWKSFARAGAEAVAAIIESYALEFGLLAGKAFLTGNVVQGAGYLALSAAAYTTAGLVRAIPMAEGGSGTVDKPTLFLAGEAGKEDFVFAPHSKGGMQGGGVTVVQNIAGSIWTTQQLQSLAVGAVNRDGRGY